MKKLNLNKRVNMKYPLQQETIDLELEIFKELFKMKFSKSFNNITLEEFFQSKKFVKEKPFKIVQCDKNVGFGVISHKTYDDLCLIHLNNPLNFYKLDLDPLEETQLKIINKLSDMVVSRNISNRLSKSLILNTYKLGSFNILPKIHKDKFGTRPIINCINHPTSNISQFIDYILQPHVRLSKSYIKDSQHLIQKLESLIIPKETIKLSSLDFESLYSNIDLNDALFVIVDFMKDKISNQHITITGFYNLLKILFDNNIFSYNKKYYRQTKGIAMGSKCGPTLANIYLSCLEDSFLVIHKPLFYGRYIDDIFCITFIDFNLDILINHFKYLKLNAVCTETVNFLDLNITLDRISNKIKFSLYIKPTNTFSYLLPSSNHPSFITENIPKGIFIRIRRICTCFIDFLYFSSNIALQLRTRNYDYNKVCKMINSIANIDRKILLEYKVKSSFKKDSIFLCRLYDNNLKDLNTNLLRNIDSLSSKYPYLALKKFVLVQNMQPNIGAITNNFIFSQTLAYTPGFFQKCRKPNCLICPLSINLKRFKLNYRFTLELIDHTNCRSSGSVYLIKCTKCKYIYIGETGRSITLRIREHLNSIDGFIPYIKHTPVSSHFNLPGHSKKDFKFTIYQTNLSDPERKLTERKLIMFSLYHKVKLINIDTSSSIYLNNFNIRI